MSVRVVALVLGVLMFSASAWSQGKPKQKSAADRIAEATQKIQSQQKYQLRYKMEPGESVRWVVEHIASTKTRMAGQLEETSSRSQSTKRWKVSSVDSRGNITFVFSLEAVKMWQKIGDQDPVAYDSKTDKEVPVEYESVADKLEKPLAVITIAPNGEVTERQTSLEKASFGTGDITVPFPKQPIAIGHRWAVPKTLYATDEDGIHRTLKARIAYELSKVKKGHAYIVFRTEVLTPVESQKIKSQIMQQMTDGYLVFDLRKGRIVRKEIEWDEKVQGYEGPDSYLQYLARMSEKIIPARGASAGDRAGSLLAPLKTEVAKKRVKIKTREGKPILRK